MSLATWYSLVLVGNGVCRCVVGEPPLCRRVVSNIYMSKIFLKNLMSVRKETYRFCKVGYCPSETKESCICRCNRSKLIGRWIRRLDCSSKTTFKTADKAGTVTVRNNTREKGLVFDKSVGERGHAEQS